jgi:hypothetical protein
VVSRWQKGITIDRDPNFKGEIALDARFDKAEVSLMVTSEKKVWKASEPNKADLHMKATNKTKEGEYTIHVTGKPTKGGPTMVDVKFKRREKM